MKYTETLIELFSVGCIFDTDTATIYPMDEDGNPDYGMPIEVYDGECSAEFIDTLSEEDYQVVEPFLI